MSHRPLDFGTSRWLRYCLLLAVIAGASALARAQSALGDTALITTSADLPWADPTYQGPLELLAGQIASHIAGRTVSVHCESDTDWATIIEQTGGDPNAESGFVATSWNGATGQLASSLSIAELASNVCVPLSEFAMATAKPTKCSTPVSAVRNLAANERAMVRTTATTRKQAVKAKTAKRALRAPGACYMGGGKTAARMPAAFWTAYSNDAIAILTLAHESVHLSGIVGGRLSNGLAVEDQQAEAKADCYGMQWMQYVAEQLGDAPDDAQAIATYFWDNIYPLNRASNPEYWSPDCRPGGALDTRPAGTTAWP